MTQEPSDPEARDLERRMKEMSRPGFVFHERDIIPEDEWARQHERLMPHDKPEFKTLSPAMQEQLSPLTRAVGGTPREREAIQTIAAGVKENSFPVRVAEEGIAGVLSLPAQVVSAAASENPIELPAMLATMEAGGFAGRLIAGTTPAKAAIGKVFSTFGARAASLVERGIQNSTAMGAMNMTNAALEGRSMSEIGQAGLEGQFMGLLFTLPGAAGSHAREFLPKVTQGFADELAAKNLSEAVESWRVQNEANVKAQPRGLKAAESQEEVVNATRKTTPAREREAAAQAQDRAENAWKPRAIFERYGIDLKDVISRASPDEVADLKTKVQGMDAPQYIRDNLNYEIDRAVQEAGGVRRESGSKPQSPTAPANTTMQQSNLLLPEKIASQNPWEMSIPEYRESKFVGGRVAVRDPATGKVYVAAPDEHHGDLRARLSVDLGEGTIDTDGFVLGGEFFSVRELDPFQANIHKALLVRRMQQGKYVSQSAVKGYPDLADTVVGEVAAAAPPDATVIERENLTKGAVDAASGTDELPPGAREFNAINSGVAIGPHFYTAGRFMGGVGQAAADMARAANLGFDYLTGRATDLISKYGGPAGQRVADEIRVVTEDWKKGSNASDLTLHQTIKDYNLTPEEISKTLGMYAEGRIPPAAVPKRVQDAALALQAVADNQQIRYASLGGMRVMPDGSVVSPTMTGHWFPQVLTKEARDDFVALSRGRVTPAMARAVKEMVAAGKAASEPEALALLKSYSTPGQVPSQSLWFSRQIDLPDFMREWDITKVLPPNWNSNERAIASIRQWDWGKSGRFPRLEESLQQMSETGNKWLADQTRDFVNLSIGGMSPPGGPAFLDFMNKVRGFQFVTKVGLNILGVTANYLDRIAKTMTLFTPDVGLETMVKYPPTINMLMRWLPAVDRFKEQAIRSGAVSIGGGPISEEAAFRSAIGHVASLPFNITEKGNKETLALAGSIQLQRDIAAHIWLDKQSNLAKLLTHMFTLGTYSEGAVDRRLARAGLDKSSPRELADIYNRGVDMMNNGPVAAPEFERMMHATVRMGAFPLDPTVMRMWWPKHPIVRALTQFKTWSIEQVTTVFTHAMREMVLGNPVPMAGFLLGGAVVGEAYHLMKDKLMGTDTSVVSGLQSGTMKTKDELERRIWKDMIQGGVVGFLQQTTNGLWDFVGGPTLGSAQNIGRFLFDSISHPNLTWDAAKKTVLTESPSLQQTIKIMEAQFESQFGDARLYGKWKPRAAEWRYQKENPTLKDKAASTVADVTYGPEWERQGADKIPLQQFTRHVMLGTPADLDKAAEYLKVVMDDAKTEPQVENLRRRLPSIIHSYSPINIAAEDQADFWAQFPEPEVREGKALQERWMQKATEATDKAVKLWGREREAKLRGRQ